MLLCELVEPKSNDNLITKTSTLTLPYDLEMTSVNGMKLLHKAGVKVNYKIINDRGQSFVIKLYRTVYSSTLKFDSRDDAIDSGFVSLK